VTVVAPAPGRVLVVNAGSSSLKLSVVGQDDASDEEHEIDRWDGSPDAPAVRAYLGQLADSARPPEAVGHRVVHGGTLYTSATVLDDAVKAGIARLTSLAPLHQPRALAGIEAASSAFGSLPQVACFDTSFHASLPAEASTYPVPAAWRSRFGLRKFGFHGLSHSYAAHRAAEMLEITELQRFRAVTCHLGAGSSLAAVQGGRSVETTMGFTPVDGLVMATRPGSIDPGMIIWLANRLPLADIADGLEHGSGLAALAGLQDGSGDMRQVIAAADAGDRAAGLALEVYTHRLVASVAAMAAAMNGLDALVFTGGIGEHAPVVRYLACAGLKFLGVAIDLERNQAVSGDADITAAAAKVRTVVVSAREDLEIARQVRLVLRAPQSRLPGQRLVDQRGPKHAHSIPQCASLRRLSSTLTRPARSSSATPSPSALPISAKTVLTCTIDNVIGRPATSRPDGSTQMLTLSPFLAPVLVGILPDRTAPDGARHRPVTQ
jgi:acetate kinase